MRSELLQEVVAELEGEDIDPLTDAALADGMVDLRRTMDRLEFQFSRRLRLFSKRQGYVTLGFVSVISWLRRACRLMPGAAMQQSEVARNLPSLPQTSTALASGDIGFHHAAVIARSVSEVGTDAVVEEESRLIKAAHNLDPKYLSYLTRRLRYSIDPDGTLVHSNDQYDHRYLHLSQTLDGVFYLDARLDPEGGATLRTALNALDSSAIDERSGAMRRADALVEMARRQMDAGTLPEVAGQKPHLSVIASAATLAKAPGAPAADLEWSQPITADAARRLACDSAMTRVLLGPNSEPIDVGRCTRTIPPALRRALVVRDRGCRFPGCDRPADWCDGHHLVHWMDGGETNLSNTCLLCRRHHRFVHELGWRLVWGDEGELLAIQPEFGRHRHSIGVAPPLVS
jgi:hypothetical protein